MHFDAVISYRATVVMQLINTCTGRPIEGPKVSLSQDDKPVPISIKPGGFCIVLNGSDKAVESELVVAGFVPMTLQIEPTKRWDRPMIVHMIPEILERGLQTHFTLQGTLPGITELSGLYLANYILRFKGYQSKTKKMAVFNRHNKPLSRIHHGLLNMAESSFIPFSAYPLKSVEEFLIEDFVDTELPAVNAPIAPLIYGITYPDGRYLFRVLDDSSNPHYLLRFVVDGTPCYQRVDFHSQEKIVLERGEAL